jgi:hypothetical protein
MGGSCSHLGPDIGEDPRTLHVAVCLDFEGTGKEARTDRVVQIGLCCELIPGTPNGWAGQAAYHCGDATPLCRHTAVRGTEDGHVALVDPGIPIPDASSKIHQIYDADVAGAHAAPFGPAAARTVARVVEFIDATVHGACNNMDDAAPTPPAHVVIYCIAHNGFVYDYPLLLAELARADLYLPELYADAAAVATYAPRDPRRVFFMACDTMPAASFAQSAFQPPIENCKLGTLHGRIGGKRGASRDAGSVADHSALGDALALSDICAHPQMFHNTIASRYFADGQKYSYLLAQPRSVSTPARAHSRARSVSPPAPSMGPSEFPPLGNASSPPPPPPPTEDGASAEQNKL